MLLLAQAMQAYMLHLQPPSAPPNQPCKQSRSMRTNVQLFVKGLAWQRTRASPGSEEGEATSGTAGHDGDLGDGVVLGHEGAHQGVASLVVGHQAALPEGGGGGQQRGSVPV